MVDFSDLDIDAPATPALDFSDLGGEEVTPEELLAIEEAKKYDSPIAAGLAGAARGATLGLSDVAGRALGYEEELKKLQEYNPTASTVGEVGGTLATAFAGPGALVAKGAQAAARPIGSSLARSAAANALEGAAYGLGGTISEQALGSEREVAESLIANVGMGAILGGGLAMAGHGTAKVGEKLSKQVKKVLKGEDPLSKWMGKMDDFYEGASSQRAASLDDLTKAAAEEGVPLTPGMQSDSFIVRGTESSLAQSPNTFGELVRKDIAPTYQRIQKQAEKIVEEQSEKTAMVVGEEIKDAFTSRLHEMYDPVKALYDDIGLSTAAIEVTPEFRGRVVKNIDDWATANTLRGSKARSAAKFVTDNLSENIAMPLDKIKAIASDLGGQANAAKVAGETQQSILIKDLQIKVNNFYERQVRRSAIESAATKPEGQEIGRQLISDMKSAKKGYREMMTFIRDVGEEAGLGKIKSVSQFLDKIDDIPSEKLTERLFNKKSVDSLKFFKEQFPEQFDAVRRVEIAKLRNKVKALDPVGNEIVDVKKLAKAAEGYSPEALQILLGEESVKSLKNLKIISNRIPKMQGPSGTPQGLDFQNIFSPAIWFRDAARYAAYKGGKIMSDVADTQTKAITSKLNSFFDAAKKPVIGVSTVGATSLISGEERKIQEVEDIALNPQKYIEKLQENTQGIANVDPGLQQSIANTAMEAVNFLSAKAPKNPFEGMMFKQKWRPSDTELSTFNRYLKAVDDPFSILDDLDGGMLTPEGVEAVKTIYPELYNKFIQMTVAKIGDINYDIPFTKQLQLSMLIGQPVSSAQDIAFVQRLQAGAQAQGKLEEAQQAPKNKKLEGDFVKSTMPQSDQLIVSRGS